MNTILLVKPLPLSRCRVITSANNRENRAEERKAFRQKINDSRKRFGDISKKIDKLMKQEISETRSLFDDHVKFMRGNNDTTSKSETANSEPKNVEVIDAEFFE